MQILYQAHIALFFHSTIMPVFDFLNKVFTRSAIALALLCPGGFDQVCKLIGIKELHLELRAKVLVGESGWVKVLHVLDNVGVASFPPVPEPLVYVAGHRKDTKVHKDTDLCPVVPIWDRPRVQALPIGLITPRRRPAMELLADYTICP